MIFRFGSIRAEFGYIKVGFFLLDLAILLSLLLAGVCASFAVYILAVAYCSDFWVLFTISALTSFLSFALYNRLREPLFRKFSDASQVMTTGYEKPATLSFPGVIGWSGLLVELKKQKSPDSDNVIVSIGVPKWFKPPAGDLDVLIKGDSKGLMSTVVVKSGKHHLVGAVRSLSEMQSEYLSMRKLLTSLLMLALAAILTIVVFTAFEANQMTKEIKRAKASFNFPTTEAHIISSQVVETKIRRGKVMVRAWNPRVEYAYSLGGDYRIGQRLTPAAGVYFDKALAQQIASRYEENSIHDLYYDPDDSTFTVLEPGYDETLYDERTIFLIKWLATFVAAVAIAVVLQLFRKKLLSQISTLVERVYGGRKQRPRARRRL